MKVYEMHGKEQYHHGAMPSGTKACKQHNNKHGLFML